ncbi:MAG TPA: hypothetical protein VKZ53_02630 [Candidatus Angelobacter sp.]|nr:hypothetical protein [Candidatus Angelobacter sp.]
MTDVKVASTLLMDETQTTTPTTPSTTPTDNTPPSALPNPNPPIVRQPSDSGV